MKNLRSAFVLGGIALILFGAIILFRPMTFTGWISVAAGTTLVGYGVLRYLQTRTLRHAPLREHPLFLGLIGLLLMINPLLPVQLAGIVLGLWAVIGGIESLLSAWRLGKLEIAWHAMTVRGLVLLLLGLLLLAEPAMVSLAIGIPIGLALIALGVWMIRG